jgi:branched-chain amino acid transport system substrate-binding protein
MTVRGIISFQVAALLLLAFSAAAQAPYKVMMSDPLDFTGCEAPRADGPDLGNIAIGLFLPDGSKDPAAMSIRRGALLAVAQANESGGYNGRPFELVRRWDDNPWAGGAREMTRLVYGDRVWAVIGFLNGAGHIAEQVAAKAYLPVLSPASSDPSLTQARLPWIFRLPPDIGAQARALTEQGISARKLKRVGIVTSADHDGRLAGREFRRRMGSAGIPPAFYFQLMADEIDEVHAVAAKIRAFSPEGLVLSLRPPHLLRLLAALKEKGITCAVFLPWMPGLDPAGLGTTYSGEIVFVEPFPRSNPRYREFAGAYRLRYGSPPSFAAAYGFDSAQMIIAALKSDGLSRSALRRALSAMSGYGGVSGQIKWDNGGGNLAVPVVRLIPEKRESK